MYHCNLNHLFKAAVSLTLCLFKASDQQSQTDLKQWDHVRAVHGAENLSVYTECSLIIGESCPWCWTLLCYCLLTIHLHLFITGTERKRERESCPWSWSETYSLFFTRAEGSVHGPVCYCKLTMQVCITVKEGAVHGAEPLIWNALTFSLLNRRSCPGCWTFVCPHKLTM